MSEVSNASPDLFLLDSLSDFQEFSLRLVQQSRRHISVLSRDLDNLIYGSDEFVDSISAFVRSSKHAQVQLLVKDTKALVESGHKLARLHQRLPSKIQLRKLTQEPDDTEMAFMICDTNALLYKNDDSVYRGFANVDAAVEIKRLRDLFDYVWQYGESEPELRILHL